MKICGIYKITSPSGNIYIGQTGNFKARLNAYKRASKCSLNDSLINRSLKKYGYGAHSFLLIHELPQDVSGGTLTTYEQIYLDQYKETGHNLLNICLAAGSTRGIKASEETKRKLREARKKRIFTKETGMRISLALKGRPKSEETKRKLREVNLGKKASVETKIKMSLTRKGNYGKKLSEETKEKIRQKQMGRSKTAEEIDKWRYSMKQMMEIRKNKNGV